jgi:hypothetical protein
MAEHEVPINDCDTDLDDLKVYVGDTVRWANNTKRRIIIRRRCRSRQQDTGLYGGSTTGS